MIEVLNCVIKALLSSLANQEGIRITGKDNKGKSYQDGNDNGAFYEAVTQLDIANSFGNIHMANLIKSKMYKLYVKSILEYFVPPWDNDIIV